MTSSYSEHALKAHDLGQLSIAHVANTFVESVSWIEQEMRRDMDEGRS